MDTDRLLKAANKIINDLENVIENESRCDVKMKISDIYSCLLRMNQFSNKFLKEFSLPIIDYSLFHENMVKENYLADDSRYFKPVEYQLNFLLYLFRNYDKYKFVFLRDIIDDYVKKINGCLKIKDIELTKTGSVRCKTNIRFALMTLRHYGLINYNDRSKRNDWSLTLFGIFICLQYYLNKPIKNDNINKIDMEYFEPFRANIKVTILDTEIEKTIVKLNEDKNYNKIIKILNIKNSNLEYANQFKMFLEDYISLLNEYYTTPHPLLFTKKYLTLRIKQLLIREDKNIENFKSELIISSDDYFLQDIIKKILNNNTK